MQESEPKTLTHVLSNILFITYFDNKTFALRDFFLISLALYGMSLKIIMLRE